MGISVNHEKDIFEKGEIKIISRLKITRMLDGDHEWRWKRLLIKRRLPILGSMNPHAVIIGETGSGKSNACKTLMLNLAGGNCNFVVLDPHNEYIGMANRINAKVHNCARNGINIFERDGMSATEKSSELTLMFTKHFRLGQYQSSVLYKCLRYMYLHPASLPDPSMRSLILVIRWFMAKATTKESSALQTLKERIAMLHGSTTRDSLSMEQILSSNNFLALAGLHTAESQAVFIEGFLRKVYTTMLSCRKPGSKMLYIIVEEAGKLGECEVLKRLISEGRKYGIGVIAVAQSAKSLDREVRINAALFISFYQREPEELNYVANFIAGGNEGRRFIEVKKGLRQLACDHALVLSDRMREPVIARFPLIRYGREDLEYSITELTRNAVNKGELMRKLYSQGFHLRESEATVERLLRKGELKGHAVEGCGHFDGTWYIYKPKNSAEHEINVRLISRKLTEVGMPNRIHNTANGPDVIGYSKEGKVAFEYETGMQSRDQFTAEFERRRKQDYTSIVVIVNSSRFEKYLYYKDIEGVKLLTERQFLA